MASASLLSFNGPRQWLRALSIFSQFNNHASFIFILPGAPPIPAPNDMCESTAVNWLCARLFAGEVGV
jgi:hypothetical protein